MRHCKTDSYQHDSQRQRHDGTCSFCYSWRAAILWPSSCCQTTSPMRHCKTDSYQHDSQR
ncbi:unnamed protein product [Staurois parvus]|uniref:Uncharacterized protein n=1 Tax=Staurois parvus TaxID=386267 RepID=A0ABN9CYQ1_9NEOB|nr:unnamed protein product [Staurois parvus]